VARRFLVVLAALGAVAAWLAVTHASGRPRPEPPPAIGAYAIGGAPACDPELEDLFGEQLAELAVSTDEARHGKSGSERERAWTTKQLRGALAIVQRGPWVTAAWQGFLDSLERWSDAPFGSRGYKPAEHDLRMRAHLLTDQLARLGLGYYIDAAVFVDRGRAHAVTLAYRVDDVSFVHVAGERIRVLALRRLDRLNAQRELLGMQSEELGDPVVLLDQVEDFISARLAPVIGGSGYQLGDDRASVRQLGDAAGEAVRRELARPDAVADLVVATVRLHEGRHAYDLARGEPPRAPDALVAYLGGRGQGAFAVRARAELTAYLSQIADDLITPQLALWNLASQAFHAERWGNAESYVAVVVLDGLARHAGGAPPMHPLVRDGALDRTQLAQLALPLAQLSDAQLRAAAHDLWHELYGDVLND
jgi:hypothetical protein